MTNNRYIYLIKNLSKSLKKTHCTMELIEMFHLITASQSFSEMRMTCFLSLEVNGGQTIGGLLPDQLAPDLVFTLIQMVQMLGMLSFLVEKSGLCSHRTLYHPVFILLMMVETLQPLLPYWSGFLISTTMPEIWVHVSAYATLAN